MKKFLIVILLLGSGLGMRAQLDYFVEGDVLVSPAVGFGNPFLGGVGATTALPPISVSVDCGIEQTLTSEGTFALGGYFGFAKTRFRNTSIGPDVGSNSTHMIIGGRLSYTYPFADKFDFLAGLMAGYDIISTRDIRDNKNSTSYAASGSVFTFFLGGRYQLMENLAAVVELGYGISILRLGVSFRI